MALGARARDVLAMFLRHGVALKIVGLGLGLAGALALSRLMSGFLYGVTATDSRTYTGIALVLCGVALLACYIPARRATRVDPITALRYE